MNNKVKSEQKLNLKKNQEISLTIEDFTKEGEGLGKYQGFPFFVKELRLCPSGRNCNTIKRQSNPAMSGRKTVWRL